MRRDFWLRERAQMGVSRLNTLAALAGVDDAAGNCGAAHLGFLQALLAHAAAALGTYIAGEVRAAMGAAHAPAERYLPPGARFASRRAAVQPGVCTVRGVWLIGRVHGNKRLKFCKYMRWRSD